MEGNGFRCCWSPMAKAIGLQIFHLPLSSRRDCSIPWEISCAGMSNYSLTLHFGSERLRKTLPAFLFAAQGLVNPALIVTFAQGLAFVIGFLAATQP